VTSPAFHHSPADPDDYPVPVGAAELAEWAVWTGLLADWLAEAGPAAAADFDATSPASPPARPRPACSTTSPSGSATSSTRSPTPHDHDHPASPAARPRPAAAPDAAAAHPPRRPRRARHRQGPSFGTPPRSYVSCSPRRSVAATAPPWPPAAPPPASPPARPSTPGTRRCRPSPRATWRPLRWLPG